MTQSPDDCPYGDLTDLNTSRLILDAVGAEGLKGIADDFLSVVGTSCAVYEKNGDYAFGIFSSGWCRLMDEASYRLCRTDDLATALASGRWLCHESCWSDAALLAIERGEPMDIECHGGIHLYGVPIEAGGEVVGAINFGYGHPSEDPAAMAELAEKYEVSVERLIAAAEDHPRCSPEQVEEARHRLQNAARLIGLMVERYRAQQAAQEASERYRLLFETMGQGVLYFDAEGKVVEANPAACRILGRTLEDFTRETRDGVAVVFDEQGRPVPMENLPVVRALRDGRRIPEEILGFPNPEDGRIHWCLGEVVPLTEPDEPRPRRLYTLFSDVTEQKVGEEALRESEERLRLSMQAANQGFYDLDLRTGDAVVSPEYATMLGYEPADFQETHTKWLDRLHPDDHPRVEAVYYDYVDGKGSEYSVEFRQRTASGDWKWIWSMGKIVERDADGVPVRMMGTHTDISDRKQAEEALRRSEDRFREMSDHVEEVFWLFDLLEQKVIYASPAFEQIWGRSVEDLYANLGEWEESIHPDDRARAISTFGRILETGASEPWEYRIVRPDGSTRWISDRAFPVRDASGQIVRVAGISDDVTDRKTREEEHRQLQAKMQHAQKLESLGVLAGGIAHDFNNLLMAILGNADLALNALAPPHAARDFLVDIEAASQRAAELCRQMLAYAGKGRFVPERLDLSRLVREMGHILRVSISKDATLRYELGTDLSVVEADASQLRQVVMNLITNASDAVGDGPGVISVTTGQMECDREYLGTLILGEELAEGRYVFVEVADTGAGMDMETRERIFDPFFTTKFTGRGLGLAAALGIVRGHGGAIKLYSEPDRGTTFRVLFPAISGEAEIAEANSQQPDAWVGSGTILLVDDEPEVRKVAARMLNVLGFDVVEAVDGQEAVERFRKAPGSFACVLLDLTMPRMDGENSFRELRRIRSDMPVILSSGYNAQEITQQFAGKGYAGFIQKPYMLASLREALQAVLD